MERRVACQPGAIVHQPVFGRIEAPMHAACFLAPSVIHHDVVADGGFVIEPRQKFFAPPRAARMIPLSIGPDDVRLIPGDEVLELGQHVLGDVPVHI